jgi:hypothetical protein
MAMAMWFQQDDMIDLAVGVNRLKHRTVAIGDEAKTTCEPTPDMETNLDAARWIGRETRRAAQLKNQSIWRLCNSSWRVFRLF